MTVGSLFAGIGGFDLAAERVFGPGCVKWQVEIDPWAQRVLAKHWPNVPRFSDIRTVTGEDLGPVDIVCGGFPCQDVSGAGSRAGIQGRRSGLWTEYARLLGELRPRFVVVENVTGLLVRGFGRVLGDLAALGYDAEWDCLPACAFGAPHARERVFLIAYTNGERWRGGRNPMPNQTRCNHWQATQGKCVWKELECWLRTFVSTGNGPAPSPQVLGVDDGIPHRLDRLRGLGNAIVPQVAEFLFRRIQEVA
jgi:DNA (cytosine-5)-methyltransferase 1